MQNNLIIVGNFIDSKIKLSRKLPAINPAASNRMIALSNAMIYNKNRVIIVSSSTAASIQFDRKIFIRGAVIKRGNTLIVCSPTIAIPILSSILELFFLPYTYIKVLWKIKKVSYVILYNYFPSLIIIALISKILRIKVIEDLQDISSLSFKYLANLKLMEKLQQFVGYFSMKIIISLAYKVLIPTIRFSKFLPLNKKVEIISGCINVNKSIIHKQEQQIINILYSGLINSEQGFYLFLDSLKIIDNESIYRLNRLVVHISGYGMGKKELLTLTKDIHNVKVIVHGFLPNEEYNDLLKKIDVCLALQDPTGKNSNLKTPSKTYEYFSFGKAVIVSDVGDFRKMPLDSRILLEPYTPANLASILLSISKSDIENYKVNALKYVAENWSYEIVAKKITG